MTTIYRGYTITREPEGDLPRPKNYVAKHQQHATYVGPRGRLNHPSLTAARQYIDAIYDDPDVAAYRAAIV